MGFRCFLLLLGLAVTDPAAASSKYGYRLARISHLEGNVSFQHAKDVEWSAASINLPLQPGDRIYTGQDGRAEIQFDEGSVLRLAEQADAQILSLNEEIIQIRILIGLVSLNAQSSVGFEINTPAAAFNTVRKGVYRFDVHENGSSDAIVRKGLLDAANNTFSERIESGEVLHVTAGERGTHTLARYDTRDEWDEWNDRRDADLVAHESRRYLPDYVYSGAGELDTYGRWLDLEAYGPAWVPGFVGSGWSPYSNGRWCYRPFWGWTWISYEPWGWLPYHYGRWHFGPKTGWCWIPGASFGFHFWSPALVRFYQGPGWVSWCPLGPGDYYNINNYFYNPTYAYRLNDLRLIQRRGPEDLANRNVPGAFRTARVDQFANESLANGRGVLNLENVERPWLAGKVVTGQPAVQPTSRSYQPVPDRHVAQPRTGPERPVIVRTEPTLGSGTKTRFSRITNPSTRLSPSAGARRTDEEPRSARQNSSGTSSGGEAGEYTGRGLQRGQDENGRPAFWKRGGSESGPGRASPGRSEGEGSRSGGRWGSQSSQPDNRIERSIPGAGQRGIDRPRSRSDDVPARPAHTRPPANRNERTAPAPRVPDTSRPASEPRRRPSERSSSGLSHAPRGNSAAAASPWAGQRMERPSPRYSSSGFVPPGRSSSQKPSFGAGDSRQAGSYGGFSSPRSTAARSASQSPASRSSSSPGPRRQR